jgi:hypothetical protein
MYRNRTWSFASPVWRFNHNRTVNINGYIPALQFIYWQPSNFVLLNISTALGPIRDTFIISDTYQPFRFRWDATGIIPRNVRLYYRKNGGSWVLFNEKTNTADTFNNGDTFQLGIQTGNSTGLFGFTLTSDADGLPCSELLSITVL